MKEFIASGIVAYNPDMPLFKKNIEAISPQCQVVFIIDNGSSNIVSIRDTANKYENVVLIENTKNLGIAYALNQIFFNAMELGYEWLITLDQDSICSDNLVEQLYGYVNIPGVGVICPKIDYRNFPKKKHVSNAEYDYIEACMTSGSLTKVQAWKNVGGFDNWMFIDYVDNDFCMRLKTRNYKIIRANRVLMYHELGNTTIKNFFGVKISLFNHSEFRNYYYCRNSIYFIKKYKNNISVKKYILILIYWELKKIFFEKNRKETINSMIKGIKNGFKKSDR